MKMLDCEKLNKIKNQFEYGTLMYYECSLMEMIDSVYCYNNYGKNYDKYLSNKYITSYYLDDNYCSVLDDYIENNDNYEDFLQDIKNSSYSTIKNYHYRLVQQVEIVQMFDKLCDKLVQTCLYLVDMQNIKESD